MPRCRRTRSGKKTPKVTENGAKSRYQDIYPSTPLVDSAERVRPSAVELLTLEYFQAPPAAMPALVFDQHHILLNLKAEPHRVENWRAGVHRDFVFHQNEIVVTPAGVESGWRWHETSNVIVITLEPVKFGHFAQSEVGILLTDEQLQDLPIFSDPDICQAGIMLRDALDSDQPGASLIFESLARVFLVKLIQRYGLERNEDFEFSRRFTSKHYKRVLDLVAGQFHRTISVEELAAEAALSPSHFARLFKETIGQSPMQFVTAYRVEQAKKRLAEPDTPLIDIAHGCGFADQAHFSRVFKQAVGLTPKAYRDGQTV